MAITLDQAKARLTQAHGAAAEELQDLQGRLIKDMEKGYALDASMVERIFAAEQRLRSHRQLAGLGDTATDVEELKGRLQEWVRDATDQLVSPGRSGFTSLVRTEQMMAETEGLKYGVRTADYLIAALSS